MDLDADYRAFREDAGVVVLPRDFLVVRGPDAVSWLQGQLSQDVAALPVGGAADSLLLQPQGKVDALLRVLRTGPDEVVIDVDGGFGESVIARLRRFKIRIKADIEPLEWMCLSVRGPKAAGKADEATGTVVPVDWPGLSGFDVVGESPALGPAGDGVRRCSREAWEVVRIEAGIPTMGAELTERTIPAEAGVVSRTVSFTKGCYTGQELVARIDSRGGNVPRHLRGVVVDGAVPPEGAELVVGDDVVGSLTSVTTAPGGAGAVGLAYVKRDVDPPAAGEVRWDGGSAAARVETLPLVS